MTFLILMTSCVIAVLLWKIASFLPDLDHQLREIRDELRGIRDDLDDPRGGR